ERVVAGLFLVDVSRERDPDVLGRPLAKHPSQKHRKVAHVGVILVPKVHEQRLARQPRPGEETPGPVIFLVHERQQPLGEGDRHGAIVSSSRRRGTSLSSLLRARCRPRRGRPPPKRLRPGRAARWARTGAVRDRYKSAAGGRSWWPATPSSLSNGRS